MGKKSSYKKKNIKSTQCGDQFVTDDEKQGVSKQSRYAESKSKRGNSLSGSNHPSWYKINDQMAKDTASIPFAYTLGERLNFGEYGGDFNNYAMPGIMRISYTPTYGWNDYNVSPLNVCARNIYTYLKSVNSRAKTYDASDLCIYIGAMDNALTFYAWMKRVYGMLMTINPQNRYFPLASIHAMGVDYHDIIKHVTQLRDYINVFATKLSAMPIPSQYSIFVRHMWLNETMYLDSNNTDKAQAYLFVPSILYHYKLDGDGAGMLEARPFISANTHLQYEGIVNYGDTLLDSILYGVGEEDFNLIGGDILYAYGEKDVIRATPIDTNYAILPTYDPAVLDQIHNAKAFGDFDLEGTRMDNIHFEQNGQYFMPLSEKASLNIRQDSDKKCVITQPRMFYNNKTSYGANGVAKAQLVDLNTMDTSPDHVLVATRLLTIPEVSEHTGYVYNTKTSTYDEKGTYNLFEFHNCASEIVNGFDIFYFATDTGASGDWKLHQHPRMVTHTTAKFIHGGLDAFTAENYKAFKGLVDNLGVITAFDQHPIFEPEILTLNESGGLKERVYPHWYYGDINNYGVIDYPELTNMNRNVIMAMFGIAKFGPTTK